MWSSDVRGDCTKREKAAHKRHENLKLESFECDGARQCYWETSDENGSL